MDATNILFNSRQATNVQHLSIGQVLSVDSSKNTASVLTMNNGQPLTKVVKLPSYCTPTGVGLRFIPDLDTNGTSSIRLYQEAGDYVSNGYTTINPALVDDADSSSDNLNAPLRYLEVGEVSLRSKAGSELFFNKIGNVVISDSAYNKIAIMPAESMIELTSANFKAEFDNVRLRMGNIRRPVDPNSYDEMYLVTDEATQEHEFMVQVGNIVNSDGLEAQLPSVGMMGLGDKIYDEYGRVIKLNDNYAQFLVKTASGGGIGIADNGDVHIIDYTGGNTTIFGSGDTGDKVFRVGSSIISVSSSTGIIISQSSGAQVSLPISGEAVISDSSGRSIIIDGYGIHLSAPAKANIDYLATYHNFIGSLNIGMLPMYGLLKAELFAAMYDVHVHAGPSGPPVIPLTPLLSNLIAMGITVS